MFTSGSNFEIRRLSYKERLESFAERYFDICCKYEADQKSDEVFRLMTKFVEDYVKFKQEMLDNGFKIEDIR